MNYRKEGVKANNEPEPIKSISEYLRKSVYLPHDELYLLASLWIVSTHIHTLFNHSGYICLCSDRPCSGKTRYLEIVRPLVCNPTPIMVSPSEAVFVRTSRDHTQLLDNVDTWRNKKVFAGILNAGSQKDSKIVRMQKSPRSDWKAVSNSVYAPRAFAISNKKFLSPATKDRCFVIEMVHPKKKERPKGFLREHHLILASLIKPLIMNWLNQNCRNVLACYENEDFPYLNPFTDRTSDICEPLAALLEVAYKDHPGTKNARNTFVRAVEITRGEKKQKIAS